MIKNIYVKIDGMYCEHCENRIRSELKKNSKIKEVTFDKNIANIAYSKPLEKKEIIDSILAAGYFTKEENISEDIKDIDSRIKFKEFVIILSIILCIFFLLKWTFNLNIFYMIPTIDSSVTYGMLVVTGLLTSIHCISMCGAINLAASINTSRKRSIKRPILYNTGRVLSYTLIGGIVGAIGSIFSLNSIVTGAIIIAAAVIMFLMSLGMLKIINFHLPKFFKVKIRRPENAFLIGILNGFMPCGPLQAMQLYALSTGSAYLGALSMFLFGIGTVPLMLFVGVAINLLKGKRKIFLNKVAAVLVLVLSIVMLNRGLLALNIDIFKHSSEYSSYTASLIVDDYQVVEFDLGYSSYEDVILQKGIPVKMIIHVDEEHLTGCNNEILINKYGIKEKLEVGENIIEFTPTEEGEFVYTCWMNMIKNVIKVIDDEEYFSDNEG